MISPDFSARTLFAWASFSTFSFSSLHFLRMDANLSCSACFVLASDTLSLPSSCSKIPAPTSMSSPIMAAAAPTSASASASSSASLLFFSHSSSFSTKRFCSCSSYFAAAALTLSSISSFVFNTIVFSFGCLSGVPRGYSNFSCAFTGSAFLRSFSHLGCRLEIASFSFSSRSSTSSIPSRRPESLSAFSSFLLSKSACCCSLRRSSLCVISVSRAVFQLGTAVSVSMTYFRTAV
mmetsp:Transcript_3092/g.7091  ORF Transcript_3092/g.7091 Transcript_3092/m.7091 type:complete len:235 (+) Transcript_3092:3357-4061(+)